MHLLTWKNTVVHLEMPSPNNGAPSPGAQKNNLLYQLEMVLAQGATNGTPNSYFVSYE